MTEAVTGGSDRPSLPRRPANRPSRRHKIMDAALELFSGQPWEQVTIAGIAARARMTPAAFYYHFGSREQLLEEIVRDFADRWVERGTSLAAAISGPPDVAQCVLQQLDWIIGERAPATVFFVASVGATPTVDELRRAARWRVAQATAAGLRRVLRDGRTRVEAEVAGLALTVLVEYGARAALRRDELYRTLGAERFRAHASDLSRRVVGG